jgi:hypothetical protein
MYNELLSEADSFKALEKNIVNMDLDIKTSNTKLVSKSKLLMLSRRRFENLEHVSSFQSPSSESPRKWLYY